MPGKGASPVREVGSLLLALPPVFEMGQPLSRRSRIALMTRTRSGEHDPFSEERVLCSSTQRPWCEPAGN